MELHPTLPTFKDPVTGIPSITVTFSVVTFALAVLSLLGYHYGKWSMWPTIFAISFWALSTIFYLIRRITKFGFDFSKKEVNFEGETSGQK